MESYKSESNEMPIEWDIMSSLTTVFHNYNVVKSHKDGRDIYIFDVEKMTHQEYNLRLQSEINLLNQQKNALSDRQDFVEDCVAEMAMKVYE